MLSVPSTPAIDLKLSLDMRERYERRVNRDFLDSAADSRTDLYSRFRPTLDLRCGEVSAALQYQFAFGQCTTPNSFSSPQEQTVSLAYVKIPQPGGSITLGRQRLIEVNDRLIGHLEWNNVARSYDGVRYVRGPWEAFYFKFGVGKPLLKNVGLVGLSHKSGLGQTLAVLKTDKTNAGSTSISTLNHLAKTRLNAAEIEFEAALQAGRVVGKDHRAWAIHTGATWLQNKASKVYVNLNAASGGHNPNRSETFDNLYPAAHKFYGSMDMTAWKNMVEVAGGWQLCPEPKTDVHVHGHYFQLLDSKDAWYGKMGAPNKGPNGVYIDTTGKSGRQVGLELDLDITHRLSKTSTLQFGLAELLPGSFIKKLNGGSANPQTWVYVMLLHKM